MYYYPPTYKVIKDAPLRKALYIASDRSKYTGGFDDSCKLFQYIADNGFASLDDIVELDRTFGIDFEKYLRWKYEIDKKKATDKPGIAFEDIFNEERKANEHNGFYPACWNEFLTFPGTFINFWLIMDGHFHGQKMNEETKLPVGKTDNDGLRYWQDEGPLSLKPMAEDRKDYDCAEQDPEINACFEYVLQRTNQPWYRYKLVELFNGFAYRNRVSWSDVRFLENEFGCPLRQYLCNTAEIWCKGYKGVMSMDELHTYINDYVHFAPDEERPEHFMPFHVIRTAFIAVVEDAMYNKQW